MSLFCNVLLVSVSFMVSVRHVEFLLLAFLILYSEKDYVSITGKMNRQQISYKTLYHRQLFASGQNIDPIEISRFQKGVLLISPPPPILLKLSLINFKIN